MAEGLFLSVVSRGVEAAYLICAVILVRILLKRVPENLMHFVDGCWAAPDLSV